MSRFSQLLRHSVGDAMAVAITLVCVQIGLGGDIRHWQPYLFTIVIWCLVLAASALSRPPGQEKPASRLTKLAFDHLLAAAALVAVLHWTKMDLDWTRLLIFSGASFVVLAARSMHEVSPDLFDAGEALWDVLLVWIAFSAAPRLAWDGLFSLPQIAAFAALQLGLAFTGGLYRLSSPPKWPARWMVQAALVAAIGLWVALDRANFHVLPGRLALVLAGHAILIALRERLRRAAPSTPGERLRTGFLFAVACFVSAPYFSPNLVGTGEAKLYSEAMKDFLVQLKAGIFPPLVSQGELTPFGSAFPFRMASYHFYLGAAINTLTAGRLSLDAVQNATLVFSAVAGVFAMYTVLRSFLEDTRWTAVTLAALYGLSPAWLGPLYGTDMYFTYMALPALPLVMVGVHRQATSGTWQDAVFLGCALAFAWLAHPPIGFWASLVVAVLELGALPSSVRRLAWLGNVAITWLTCAVLCAGLFVSLWELRIGGQQADPSPVVLRGIHSVFPAVVLPAGDNPFQMSDIQPGYALLILLLATAIFSVLSRFREVRRWVAATGLLLGLTLPVPLLTPMLWKAMPYAVTTISNIWPMQRIMPVMAATGIFSAGLILARFIAGKANRERAVMAACLPLVLWSGFEAEKYVRRGFSVTRSAEETRRLQLTENSPMFINWAAFLPSIPASHSAQDGHDPRLLNRLLDTRTLHELFSNFGLVRQAGQAMPWTSVTADPLYPGVWRLHPDLTLTPGKRYLLMLEPTAGTTPGLLQISGPQFFRQIGRLMPSGPVVETPIWTSLDSVQTLELHFVPGDSSLASTVRNSLFASKLIPYQAEALPIRIESFAPYVARVDAPQPAWLETHRFYLDGYRAQVNGAPAAVIRSPEGLAMVPVPAGSSKVQLDYTGSVRLRAALCLSCLAWMLLAAAAIRAVLRRRQSPVTASSS